MPRVGAWFPRVAGVWTGVEMLAGTWERRHRSPSQRRALRLACVTGCRLIAIESAALAIAVLPSGAILAAVAWLSALRGL